MNVSKFDSSFGIAAALWRWLAVFFARTRTGGRCARSPTTIRAALAVGISLA